MKLLCVCVCVLLALGVGLGLAVPMPAVASGVKGIQAMLVCVTDRAGHPIAGATVGLGPAERKQLAEILPQKNLDKLLAQIGKPTVTDARGCAVAYYFGGRDFENDRFSCSLPADLIVKAPGYGDMIVDYTHRGTGLSLRPAESVVPYCLVTLGDELKVKSTDTEKDTSAKTANPKEKKRHRARDGPPVPMTRTTPQPRPVCLSIQPAS